MKIFSTISLAGAILIAFLLGTLTMHYKLAPAIFFENALDYTTAYREGIEQERSAEKALGAIAEDEISLDEKQQKKRIKTSVIPIYKPDKSYNGLTLINLDNFPRAALLDMQGNIVHSWELRHSQSFGKSMHKKQTCKDRRIIWSAMHLYPDGDLLAIYHCRNNHPAGHGLVKVNRNSELLWKVKMQAHHDIKIGPDGKIYTLNLIYSRKPIPGYSKLRFSYNREYLIIFSPEGKLLKKIDLLTALLPVKGNAMVNPFRRDRDYIHTNSIDILTPELAPSFPQFKEGDILLSMRNLSMLVVLDGKTYKAKWTRRGPWRMQHYARFQPNGTIQMFDNRGKYSKRTHYSRVIEVDPETTEIKWQFTGNVRNMFHSYLRGSQQTLPNNNVLINSARQGRLLEVTRAGEIVWEFRYYNKPLVQHQMDVIVTAIRFKPEELPFLEEIKKEKDKEDKKDIITPEQKNDTKGVHNTP